MSSSDKLTPNLYKLSNLLEENRLLIGTNWIKVQTVKAVFDTRKISIKKFRDRYGISIIEYFISVVREEETLGDCPIMSKLVNYLISKNITPREVFDICIGFRGSLIIFLLRQDVVLKNPIPFMQEVETIFDANLSGVLNIFTNLYAKSQKKIEHAKSQKIKLEQTLKIINFLNTKIIIVQNGRIILANKPFLEMLDVDDLKCLYNRYENGFEYLSEIDTFQNDFNLNISEWIKKIYKNNKPFQCRIYNENKKRKFNYSGRITEMPTEETEQYIITFNNISEHIKDEKTLQDLIKYDELTGFRNYPVFEKLVKNMIEKSKSQNTRLFLAIADIPTLREINELEGRDKGDMVISEVAEDLRFLVKQNIYLSRLEGSRIGILMQYPTEQDSYDWCIKLYKKMNQRKYKKTLAITEVDLSESVNRLFLRAYDLIEFSNNSEDNFVGNDFKNIIEYRELPEQKEFTKRLSKYKSLNMTLFYLELPISREVKILFTDNEYAKILVPEKQLKIAKLDMEIYFKLENIGFIKATISNINKDKSILSISRFRFDKHSPLNRNRYRIEVPEDIKAYIENNNREYSVKVLDMNYNSIAIEIDRKRNFDINSLVFLDMLLSIDDALESCVSNATITRINKVPNGYKMVLLLHLDSENEQLLKRFISKHQMSIIQNLS